MKLLILVRHGEYAEDTGTLTAKGREQIGILTEKLKQIIGGIRVIIFTSPAPRAKESADILSHAFGGGTPDAHYKLSPGEDNFDPARLLDLVRIYKDSAEVLILVTHVEYAEGFPKYYVREVLGEEITSGGVFTGEACVVNCEDGSTSIVNLDP